MKQLNKIQSVIFLLGGILMVIGAGCYVAMWLRGIVCWVFLVGAVMFSLMQTMQIYTGIFFVVAGVLMADSHYHFFQPMFSNYADYIEILYNKWVVLLLIAAVIEVYTTHRIDHELSKKNIKE